jgi:hypothetical protein
MASAVPFTSAELYLLTAVLCHAGDERRLP